MTLTPTRAIRIAHSPDADDAFMFSPLADGRLDPGELQIEHVLCDIETLNQAALEGTYEVSAISIAAYPTVAGRYRLMSCGASMGEGYGPVVVAREPRSPESLVGQPVAIPGLATSAYLAARLRLGAFDVRPVRYDQIVDAVRSGDVAAGVLIHEGQLSYPEQGLVNLCDLGQWWCEDTGLPLPLGGNVVRRDLGPEMATRLTSLVRRSIELALAERDVALTAALPYADGLDRAQADRFVGMYVNARTIDYGPDGREAVARFLQRGCAAGLIDSVPALDWVD